MGVKLLRHGVGGVAKCGVLRRVLFLLSASFGIDSREGGVDASAVLGVGFGGFLRLYGSLVTAGSALVGVVGAAKWAVADKALATCAAGGHVIRVANVALLRGAMFVLVWWLVRLGGKVVWVGG